MISETYSSQPSTAKITPNLASIVDDVLAHTLVAIIMSAGESRAELHLWWSKAIQLSYAANLHRLDADDTFQNLWSESNGNMTRSHGVSPTTVEEARRVFYLLFSLDRHLALSSNTALTISDSDICVFVPLPESVWENPDTPYMTYNTARMLGPPLKVSGTSFYEHFLPLMTILGDIIMLHRLSYHPRLSSTIDEHAANTIAGAIEECRQSIEKQVIFSEADDSGDAVVCRSGVLNSGTTPHYRRQITAAYSMHILDVLAVLLYGKWDPISMLDNTDGWITSAHFQRCSMHSISASNTVSRILTLDPELKLMPYLFGIYLLHGSFVLLLFADRMPQLGLNTSVEHACETLIRAHEVCAATLNTEYQVSRVFCTST